MDTLIIDPSPNGKLAIIKAADLMAGYVRELYATNRPLPTGEMVSADALHDIITDITVVRTLMTDMRLDGAPIAVCPEIFNCILACLSLFTSATQYALRFGDITEDEAMIALKLLDEVATMMHDAAHA